MAGTPPDVGSLRCRLLVGAQLVRLESERIDGRVGGRLDGRRLRIVDVILGMHGQVLLDCIVDQVEVLSHASGRQVRAIAIEQVVAIGTVSVPVDNAHVCSA